MKKDNITEEDKQMMVVYEWIDSIPLSREKKNIARDFSDGLLLAEILKQYYPKLVDLHNYPSASSTKQKMSNWSTLSRKVFKKVNLAITQDEINDVIASKPKVIEKLLIKIYKKVTMQPTIHTSLNLTDSDDENGNNNMLLNEQLKIKEEEYISLTQRRIEIEQKLSNNEICKINLLNKIKHLSQLISGQQ